MIMKMDVSKFKNNYLPLRIVETLLFGIGGLILCFSGEISWWVYILILAMPYEDLRKKKNGL